MNTAEDLNWSPLPLRPVLQKRCDERALEIATEMRSLASELMGIPDNLKEGQLVIQVMNGMEMKIGERNG